MGPIIFFLCALASTASAWEFTDQIIDRMHSHHASALREMVYEYVKPQRLPLHTLVPKTADTCGDCMRPGAKFIVEHALAKLKEGCVKAAANNCRFAKVCALMGEHPNATLGMVIEHVRPLSLSMAYCVGKGACDKPDETALTEITTGHEPHEALLESFDKMDWSMAIDNAETVAEPPQSEEEPEAEDEEPEALMCLENKGMPKICPKCMKRTMKRVMFHAVMKVKAMCKTTQCPMLQKMCPWAAQNQEIAFGMLLGKVEPWKIAFGFCMHRGHRAHGRHNHGKHGHHGHGHHDQGHHGHGHHGHGHHGYPQHEAGHHGHGHPGHWQHGHHGRDAPSKDVVSI